MSGTSAWLTDHVASLLPKTVASVLPEATAGACFHSSPWVEYRVHCRTGGNCCHSSRHCHLSCYGKNVCGAWHAYYCS